MKDLIVNGLYSERSRIHFDQIQESHRHNQIIPRAFFSKRAQRGGLISSERLVSVPLKYIDCSCQRIIEQGRRRSLG